MRKRFVGVPVVVILAAAGAVGTSAGTPASARTVPAAVASPSGSVTLITGDRVELNGGTPPQITPGPGRRSMPFRVSADKGHIQVVPGDAATLLATGRLDQRLFDVTTLLEDGYGDTQRKDLSLIVQYDPGTPHPLTAAENTVRQLSSVHGASIAVSKKDAPTWWNAATHLDRGTRTLGSGLTKVWLNGRRHLAEDANATQIGAPVAWQAGLTGKNVRVAIIDGGIDTTHPDLAGKVDASANFTSEPAGDFGGHGTHVASTVAGSGAASGGKYQGIAPDARLLDAKVCDQYGSCPDDAIIAGMQWAAAQHASVANVSLGGADTPDVDPVEQAVNALSAQYGTLFVVAAGNTGSTVQSPGSADAALTVGAVDGQDVVADFSSRGPTAGDTLKPDLTAPGVDIVGARAAGTELGEVVDQQYVKLSGTSMATPHVSAAAAILFQQHPDWTGEQVKDALMASAKTLGTTGGTVGVFDQGAGRVDIAKAITQSVMAQPASLSFGMALWPHGDDAVLSKTVTYRNTGTADVTLDLALEATGPDGTPAPAGLFTVSPARTVVPAGGTQQVTVAVDTRSDQVPVGRYSGRLIATGGGSSLTTPVAVEKESEHYNVQITHIGRDGGAPGEYVTYLDRIGDCGTDPSCGGVVSGSAGQTTLRLPPGQYTLAEFSTTAGRNDTNLLMQPVLDVERDVSLTVDARRAQPVRLTAPRSSARLMEWDLNAVRDVHRLGQVLTYSVSGDYSTPLYTADLGGPPAGKDEFVGFVQGRLAEPGPADDYTDSPYEYELAGTSFGQLFTGLRLQPAQKDFATVDAQYDAVTDQPRDVKTAHVARPASGPEGLFQFFSDFGAQRLLAKAPFHRTEYYLAEGLQWLSSMQQGDVQSGALDFILSDSQWRSYRPGQTYHPVPWSQGVFGPNFRDPQLIANGFAHGVLRRGDQFAAGVDMFVDSAPDHLSEPKAQRATAQLYRDGQLIQDWPSFAYVSADLPPDKATYRLAATVTSPISQISTTITSDWTFQSEHVDGDQAAVLPLLNVRYTPALDAHNHARPGEHYLIPVAVSRQPGAGTATIAKLTVEASDDDGKTWSEAPLARNGGGWVATVDNPGGGSVSLRAHAQDTDGNELDQTIIRAYLVNS
ncbi:S8 family peptidase [Rugosimonospora africana]|uniref:Serine protease n=1 Tax=Rugosimonospora africana TaxID=556532 RepID=A0A8J3VP55_9ACTN|nr:S8 family serine peptidase [Rugosimonospora africana]GIH13016.1 serine protease [Rugosimonospora africana]